MARLVNLEIFKLSSNSVKVAGYSARTSLFVQNQVRFKRKVPIVDDFNYVLVFLLVDPCVQFWISPVRDVYPGAARSNQSEEQVALVTNHLFRGLIRQFLQSDSEKRPNMEHIIVEHF